MSRFPHASDRGLFRQPDALSLFAISDKLAIWGKSGSIRSRLGVGTLGAAVCGESHLAARSTLITQAFVEVGYARQNGNRSFCTPPPESTFKSGSTPGDYCRRAGC